MAAGVRDDVGHEYTCFMRGGEDARLHERFSDGFDALQIQATSSGRRPPGLFIQENAGGGDYFIGGGAGCACMNDLVKDDVVVCSLRAWRSTRSIVHDNIIV